MELCVKEFGELSTDELYEIMKLRVSVFVVEQQCPYMELDGVDKSALHVWLRGEEGEILAYLRVMDKSERREFVSLGRVIAAKRRCGLGSEILRAGIRVAKERFGAEKIYIEAQCYAREFYGKQGFVQISEEFLEDGIPHIKMLLSCAEE